MAEQAMEGQFGEAHKEAAGYLLEKFWILRDRQPDMYQLIREREQVLRDYFFDKCGFYLIVHKAFIKLEKIPHVPLPWMGFQHFDHPREYALLCCLLALAEGKSIDEQFLLSDICETLPALYPRCFDGEEGVNWERYEWRRSLVRVLNFVCDMGIINLVDGEIGGFAGSRDSEVLFEVPVTSRYFLRSYPKDLFQYKDKAQLIEAEASVDGQLTGRARRHRVYRQLLLTSAFERFDAQEEDFLYMRNMRNRLRDDLDKHTPFTFELYNHVALLTVQEKRSYATVFPDQRGLADVVLHFAAQVRRMVEEGQVLPEADGTIALTAADFDQWLLACKQQTGSGWSKEYREMAVTRLAKAVRDELIGWKMARREDDLGMLVLTPLVARMIGAYPEDYGQGDSVS